MILSSLPIQIKEGSNRLKNQNKIYQEKLFLEDEQETIVLREELLPLNTWIIRNIFTKDNYK